MSLWVTSTNKVCKYKDIQEFVISEIIFHHEEEDLEAKQWLRIPGSRNPEMLLSESTGDAHETWPQILISLRCLKSRIPTGKEIADHGGFLKTDIEVTDCLPSFQIQKKGRKLWGGLWPTLPHRRGAHFLQMAWLWLHLYMHRLSFWFIR